MLIYIMYMYSYTLYNYHTAQSACANDQIAFLNLIFNKICGLLKYFEMTVIWYVLHTTIWYAMHAIYVLILCMHPIIVHV